METQEQIQENVRQTVANLLSGDATRIKRATDQLGDYTRSRIREDGFLRNWIPPETVEDSDLVRAVDHADNMCVFDREPDSGPAISAGYDQIPDKIYLKARRWAIVFQRIFTPRVSVDVGRLRTWKADLRKIVSDNMVRDMTAEEDGKWIRIVNKMLVGPNVVLQPSNVAQYQVMHGSITRDTIAESFNIIPSCDASFPNNKMILNHITLNQFLKPGMEEVGGTLAQDIYESGWSRDKYMGVDMCVTIKRKLVPNMTIYYSTKPEYVGKFLTLHEPIMHVDTDAFFVEFFAYSESGMGIANQQSIARVDYK